MKTELTQDEKDRLIKLGGEIHNARSKGYPIQDDELIEYYQLVNKYNRLKETSK